VKEKERSVHDLSYLINEAANWLRKLDERLSDTADTVEAVRAVVEDCRGASIAAESTARALLHPPDLDVRPFMLHGESYKQAISRLHSRLGKMLDDRSPTQVELDGLRAVIRRALEYPIRDVMRPGDWNKLVAAAGQLPQSAGKPVSHHYVPPGSQGERCRCGRQAMHKIAEDILQTDSGVRHPFTTYACCQCFSELMGLAASTSCFGQAGADVNDGDRDGT
jgi:hypothetical protein